MGKLTKKRVALYARVSTFDQKTLSLQISQIKKYVKSRDWQLTLEVEDVSSGAKERPKREKILEAARRREIDFIIVWKLDRWGRSVVDLLTTLKELDSLGVGFISLTEALDLSTPTGRAMTGLLAVFAEFERELMQERIKAGIAHSRKSGKPHGRPKTVALKITQIQKLKQKGLNYSEIARKLKTSRTSVRRLSSPLLLEG